MDLRLLAITAHPDDETLGFGGTLARYAAEGVSVYVLAATRGQSGRYGDGSEHPGPEQLGRIREAELRAAAAELGVREVSLLDYMDGSLDSADPAAATGTIAGHIRRIRPHVVITFAPDGSYGHPDHIAISQFATAAIVRAADANDAGAGDCPSHVVAKLYYMATSHAKWDVYQFAFKKLVSRVDGIERLAVPWEDWMITTSVDTLAHWNTVWRAVQCHASQLPGYQRLGELSEQHHHALWGVQEYYRAFSLVNGGRRRESDLFEGLR
jgi:LmbE family N-acetylglucosaminyl deacetylase